MKEELIPIVDNNYRTDTTSRTIMGHSFGGYFVLYALLQDLNLQRNDPGIFNFFVSASPSLNYFNGYIVKKIAASNKTQSVKNNNLKKLFISMGSQEMDGDTKLYYNKLIESLKKQKQLQLHTTIYPETDHMGTALPTFEEALLLIYAKKHTYKLK